ncbi:uncharacterized protein [Periplaneta americana]|uniref:uncharacterized protein n=1 Tax=Periplaneta americana TaxID=6978 RepID=UPI0037E76659
MAEKSTEENNFQPLEVSKAGADTEVKGEENNDSMQVSDKEKYFELVSEKEKQDPASTSEEVKEDSTSSGKEKEGPMSSSEEEKSATSASEKEKLDLASQIKNVKEYSTALIEKEKVAMSQIGKEIEGTLSESEKLKEYSVSLLEKEMQGHSSSSKKENQDSASSSGKERKGPASSEEDKLESASTSESVKQDVASTSGKVKEDSISSIEKEHDLASSEKEKQDSAPSSEKEKEDAELATEVQTLKAHPTQHKQRSFKVLVIGSPGTGKTSIITRHVDNNFSRLCRATIGVNFRMKTVKYDDYTTAQLKIWDIAGEERFEIATTVYYRDASGAFIVCDVERPGTFEAAARWKKDLDSKVHLPCNRRVPTVLLINKYDEEMRASEVCNERKIEQFCDQHKISAWFYTSAKYDLNIKEAFNFLIMEMLKCEHRTSKSVEEESGKRRLSDHSALTNDTNETCSC